MQYDNLKVRTTAYCSRAERQRFNRETAEYGRHAADMHPYDEEEIELELMRRKEALGQKGRCGMKKPVRATLVFGLFSALAVVPLLWLFPVRWGLPFVVKMALWADLALYAVLLCRLEQNPCFINTFPFVAFVGDRCMARRADRIHSGGPLSFSAGFAAVFVSRPVFSGT